MLINAVFYEFAPERSDEAQGLLAELRDASRQEPGCRRFDIGRCVDVPHVFVLYEEWDDRAALDAHYATGHFQRLGADGIRPLAKTRTGHICVPLP